MTVRIWDNKRFVLRAKLFNVIDIAETETGYSVLIVKNDKHEVMKFGKDDTITVVYGKEDENVD